MEASIPEGWVLVDPKEPLPCSLGVVVPEFRVEELGRLEQEGRERSFLVRAVLSDHVPLAGSMAEILNRPSHHRVAVNDHQLSIYLHHGGRNAVNFDLIGADRRVHPRIAARSQVEPVCRRPVLYFRAS